MTIVETDMKRAASSIFRRNPATSIMVACALVFGIVGLLTLLQSHAATPFLNTEPETGSVALPASVVTDSTASGSKAVLFAAAGTGTGSMCAPYPAFPTTSCTGVPAGQALSSVASLTTTATGQVIDGKLVTGDLILNHDNVTITNTHIMGVILANGHRGLKLTNVDIGPDQCPTAGSSGRVAIQSVDGFTMKNSHIHNNPDDLIRVGGGQPFVITDSIIDRGCYYAGDHLDAIQWYDPGGVGSVSVVHSIVDVSPVNSTDKGNSAIFWADGTGPGTTLTVYNSKLSGGQITTALYDAVKGSGTVLDIHDNVYVKNSYAGAPCSFGSSVKSIVFDGTSGVKFSNNKFDDGTAVSCN